MKWWFKLLATNHPVPNKFKKRDETNGEYECFPFLLFKKLNKSDAHIDCSPMIMSQFLIRKTQKQVRTKYNCTSLRNESVWCETRNRYDVTIVIYTCQIAYITWLTDAMLNIFYDQIVKLRIWVHGLLRHNQKFFQTININQ